MNPHLSQPVLAAGAPLKRCRAAAILVHGRGRGPEEMLALAEELALPDVAYVAPAPAGRSWYPHGFLEPLERNQPQLDHALAAIGARVAELEAAGLPSQRIVMVGFSQGACLTAEYVRRSPAPYGGVVLFTGGLPGPKGSAWLPVGDLGGAPLLIGGAERDSWVPAWRMRESAELFQRMGARVSTLIYPGDSHVVSPEELAAARAILSAAAGAP